MTNGKSIKWQTYDFEHKSQYSGEYSPEGAAADEERIGKLKQVGELSYTMKSANDIKQTKQPYIIKTEEWHYMVKNWLIYGYYFIYDGSKQTAKEIQKATSFLNENYEFDTSNPLLIANVNQTDLYKNNDSKQISKKIDDEAKKLNEALANNNYSVRLQHINFEKKSSLAAFSILEAMHTEDSEYIYRDLKEFLVELGYFTRADFESIETDVFKWIIEGYNVYKGEWPNAKYEKNNNEYGAFIRSKKSLEDQRGDEEEAAAEEAKKKGTSLNSSDNLVLGSVSYAKGYKVTNMNGVAYRNYKQNDSRASLYVNEPYWGGTIATDGCGPTSACVLLSGYGINMNPKEFINKTGITYTGPATLCKALNSIGMSVKEYSTGEGKKEEHIERIEKALKARKPVMVSVVGKNGGAKDNTFTKGAHWMCLLGVYSNGTVVISEVGNGDIDVPTVTYSSVKDFVKDYMVDCGYLIPDNAPSGATTTHELVGFKKGSSVVMPETGKITKIGNRDEDSKNEKNENKTNNTQENKEKDYFATNGDYIRIEFNTGNGVNGWSMEIEGFKITASEGAELNKGDEIGTTTDSNIKIILYDNNNAIINNVEDYFKLYSGTRIKNDYNVDTTCGENVITNVEDFKKMFSEFKNIVDNAQAFIDMQSKYKVNAVFAACVTIVESSGGTRLGSD